MKVYILHDFCSSSELKEVTLSKTVMEGKNKEILDFLRKSAQERVEKEFMIE